MTRITVAAIQAGSPLFDTPQALAKAEKYIREAASAGASVIVLPEAFLGGYPKGLDFGITVGSRSAEGRDTFSRYAGSAITVPGAETDRLAELAAELGANLVVGAIERERGTLYCV
jgi:nitrilase